MPDYRVTYFYEDIRNGTTNKSFIGTFANDADATQVAEEFRVALQACTIAAIKRMELAKITDFTASVPTALSNVFARVVATVTLNDTTKKASIEFPSPAPAILTGNALNQTSTEWLALLDNLTEGNWTVSDGEYVSGTVAGKYVVRASGKSNLPS